MKEFRVESSMAWAEDTALLGSNRSADPGAKTERRATVSSLARLSPSDVYVAAFGIGIKAKNPAGRSLASWEKKKPGDGLPAVAYSGRRELHFTLNQYMRTNEYRAV